MPQLLGPDDPPVFQIAHEPGDSAYVIACDHAGRALPKSLGDLGLTDAELATHIAWDIGIAGVARILADRLDGYLLLNNYSRLVIDTNRPPGSPQSVLTLSEATRIPGNENLTREQIELREREVFWVYHNALEAEFERRARLGLPTIFVALHSFTPVYLGMVRQWDAGVLYQRDPRLAHHMLEVLRAEPGLQVGDNEPYRVSDATDYSCVVYGEKRGVPHVEIELRQDLLLEPAGQHLWAERLVRALASAPKF
jgi:predicted N-formylglutamate amidohydrolase